MIETKYGVKYPMPHSVLHIVDNSSYAGELPTIIAEDPSLFSTIVVSGLPMGRDNVITTITRDDVLNAAFGVSNITTADRKKYGQTIGYASSLLSQGAPVRLMRVTPEDSTYAVNCIVVQWRIDETDNKMHVRFKEVGIPAELQLNKFKNTSKLNDALVKNYKNDRIIDGEYTWKQRVFISNISAGRGKVYNYMCSAINSVSQSKNPANVCYQFATIDTRTNQAVEKFNASLVNRDNINRMDYIETVNVLVNKRVEGSSVVVPYVNETAVLEVYNDYSAHFVDMLDTTTTDEFTKNVYASLNVNTFDMIYGNYIYNGTESASTLPYYQVDMYDTDIISLPTTNRIGLSTAEYDASGASVLYDSIEPLLYGVTRAGDTTYVGDMYLTTTGNIMTNPTISVVAAINQYTGAVTSLTIPRVYPLKSDASTYVVDKTTNPNGVAITTIFNDATSATTGAGSYTLNKMVSTGALVANNVVALVTNGTFKLFTVMTVTPTATTGDKYTLSPAYDNTQLINAIAWNSHSSGDTGVGNIIGRTVSDAAFNRVGAMVIDTATGDIYVNDHNVADRTDSSTFDEFRIKIENNNCKFGTCPTDVNITTSLIGAEYDLMIYDEGNADSWTITGGAIATAGTGYAANDVVSLSTTDDAATITTKFKVLTVGTGGEVLTVAPIAGVVETSTGITGTTYTTTNVEYDEHPAGVGTGLTITVAANLKPMSYTGNPTKIVRYMVSGVQGSIFRIAAEPIIVPANYYSDDYGINMSSEVGGVKLKLGSTGFFDDESMDEIEFKWRYSALLVKAYRGELDPRIKSPVRVPAKYLFDGGHNTIVGQTILPYLTYAPADIINASTIFTADEKEEVMFNPSIIEGITEFEDIDVKQAMYDLMIYRLYQGMPEDMRPVGPGSGLSLHLDSGITDANTAMLINESFKNRFSNPNASWDIGGWVDTDGNVYTYTQQLVNNLVRHCKAYTVNKPYTGKYSAILKENYISYFPDIDVTDWDMRAKLYNSGGNAWIPDINGNITRRSQRTLERDSTISDLIQENNMRTLSQFTYLLQNKIDEYLLEYDDDGVLKTLSDEVNNMFSNWVGTLVEALDIQFERGTNIDGGDILICYANVTFRGLILRVPIIVNVNRRS